MGGPIFFVKCASTNSKAVGAPTPDGFAFVPLRASDGIRWVIETGQ
jgi:hypothetical protein